MAASVRIEDEAFSDQRYSRLALQLGLADADHARGKMLLLWRQCTIENRYDLDTTDIQVVLGEHGVEALIDARLGEMLSSRRVRICGTKGRIEWLKELRKGAKKGGRSRIKKAKRDKKGRLLPSSPRLDEGRSRAGDASPALSSAPAPAPAPAPTLHNTEPDDGPPPMAGVVSLPQSPGKVADDRMLSAADVELHGTRKYGRLGGTNAAKVARLAPVSGWELKKALAGWPKKWGGFVDCIEEMRSEAEKPKTKAVASARRKTGEVINQQRRLEEQFGGTEEARRNGLTHVRDIVGSVLNGNGGGSADD